MFDKINTLIAGLIGSSTFDPQSFLVPEMASNGLTWNDCDAEKDINHGSFGPANFLNVTYEDKPIYGWVPTKDQDDRKFPLVAFMHGSTGQWEFYNDNLELYSSHGAVIVFPFVKSPEKDKSPFTTNTDGTYLIKAVEYAKAANKDPSSPLYNMIDEDNVVIAGHSMGATCSIAASHKLPPVKLTIAQHPGICGPFGPPPSPNTWMPSDLNDVMKKNPVLFTTATNDGAFWPAPYTAEHEHGCFMKSLDDSINQAAFVQFSKKACEEDKDRSPFPDGGHNCPMKFKDGGKPENTWVLAAIKLYTQQNGSPDSQCYKYIWGNDTTSMRNSPDIDLHEIRHD